MRNRDGSEGAMLIVHASWLRCRAEECDGVGYGGAPGLGGHPIADQFEALCAEPRSIGSRVAAGAENRLGFADGMVGEAGGLVGSRMRGVAIAIIRARKDGSRGIDSDEVAEEFELLAARFDLGDGAASLQHIAKNEIDGHELIEVEGHAGADERRDAEGETGFVHAAVGPDGAGDGKAEVA